MNACKICGKELHTVSDFRNCQRCDTDGRSRNDQGWDDTQEMAEGIMRVIFGDPNRDHNVGAMGVAAAAAGMGGASGGAGAGASFSEPIPEPAVVGIPPDPVIDAPAEYDPIAPVHTPSSDSHADSSSLSSDGSSTSSTDP